MDWVAFWTAAAAFAAWVAAVGALGALLAITLQLQLDRESREVDYYRKLTPFLSYETTEVNASGASPGQAGTAQAINVYADGGGYAFNVDAKIVQTNATSGGGTLLGQRVIRYLREAHVGQQPLATIAFSPKAAQGFQGRLMLKFVDLFGIHHEAHQAVRIIEHDRLETTDAIHWACGEDCHVHMIRPSPPPGALPRLARRLRLY
jgi:hypothetical protein